VIRASAREGWLDWRRDSPAKLTKRLSWPLEGVLFDVRANGFWPTSWGHRPAKPDDAERTARTQILKWPKLVPVYSHRYLPAAPCPSGAPVFSVYQTDVIYYGVDLVDYVRQEFGLDPKPQKDLRAPYPLAAWSDLVNGVEVGAF
jgi:hypothetical protein